MARPKVLKDPIEISVSTCLSKEDLQALERITNIEKVGRSTIIRRALRQYLTSVNAA
ncbi:ribbon-helix-helix protein, CopG family [Kovacikia minuta CCNUW1]|uniref:ribbon-helix-helix protein, CopG family n=1 Tax=Kovacikia minuta TaxID=2931930 RepID=UPI001CC96D33|nr:ribbon-helix-helix protein, CopG family [Kovacikia minuta CCNUW1]